MATADIIAGLAAFDRRGAGTDAERRAARWLSTHLRGPRRTVSVETFWCRPNSALAHAWHVGLGLAGSLIAVGVPWLGGALVLTAMVSTIADELTGVSLGRRLTPERASQNVVARPHTRGPDARIRLILTANYDAERTGLVRRRPITSATAWLGRLTGNLAPGWLAWLTLAFASLIAVAILRVEGTHGTGIGAAQLVPTVGLVIALALLLELASADHAPAAGDKGSGVAAVLGTVKALDVAPPSHAAVDVVLTGAGDPNAIGLRRYLRRHRSLLRPSETIVLGIASCAVGSPVWLISDGPLIPRRYFARLRELCAEVAADQPHLDAHPHRGRATGPAFPARKRGLPAITIGTLEDAGRRARRANDTAGAIRERSIDATVQFTLMLVDAIDAHLRAHSDARRARERPPAATRA